MLHSVPLPKSHKITTNQNVICHDMPMFLLMFSLFQIPPYPHSKPPQDLQEISAYRANTGLLLYQAVYERPAMGATSTWVFDGFLMFFVPKDLPIKFRFKERGPVKKWLYEVETSAISGQKCVIRNTFRRWSINESTLSLGRSEIEVLHPVQQDKLGKKTETSREITGPKSPRVWDWEKLTNEFL